MEHTPTTANPPKARRKLPFWAALALSVATVGPTLAMSGNGQGLVSIVGKAIPLVFVIGLVGVALVGYSFVRLTRHLNHAGSAYALVGGTIGPRAGFFSGFAMLGAYVGFAIGTLALTGAFLNAFLAELAPDSGHPPQISWLVVALVGAVISFFVAGRDFAVVARVLMMIEGTGIVAMIVLVAVIFGKGGAPHTGVDLSVLSFSGVKISQLLSGVVAAFLSWAGFEACASLGEETSDPKRNIPRALGGTLLLTGILFIVVMFAQTIGFGTGAKGLAEFASSGNTLGQLGQTYVGRWFSLIVIFTSVCAAFGCHLATTATSGRMLFAFARDGFGPAVLAKTDPATGAPRVAARFVLIFAIVTLIICKLTGWPASGTSNAAISVYFLFAVLGSVCLMVAYLMVELAALFFVGHPKFVPIHGGTGRIPGLLLPALGAVVIVVVLWYNVKDSTNAGSAALLGLYWCALGLFIAIAASRIAARVGAALTAELELPVLGKELSSKQVSDLASELVTVSEAD